MLRGVNPGWCLGLGIMLSGLGYACADPVDSTLADLYTRGAYAEAAAGAEKVASADNLAFAARSILSECMTGDDAPTDAQLERAIHDAEQAIRLDPEHAEGRLQLAIGLSLLSRNMGAMEASRKGLGERGHDLAKAVLQDEPANYYAHGFLAVWHIEVRHRGGTLGAAFMGASMKEARRHYLTAAGLAPDDVGVHWQYARSLAALNSRKYDTEILSALHSAIEAKADDHVEQVMQARARQLLNAMEGNKRTAEKLARVML